MKDENRVPPIKELKLRCKSISRDPLIAVAYRRISIYLTWLILHTPITANQVTALEVIVSSGGSLFFLFKDPLYWVLGFLVLQLSIILDCTDGEVARYYKTFTHRAEQYGHIIKDIFFHSFVTLGLFLIFGNVIILIIGILIIVCRIYLFIVLPKAILRMDRKRSLLAKIVTEIGGFFQFLIVPIILDILFGSAYFRLSFLVITGLIYLPMAVRIFNFQRSYKPKRENR
ncbi:MAG: CDP-alcohol phosphatidyltransferase family protein [Theionarchaea archaeon]|nr:CDP-alcohol phosphatidyltransferase family protein [Theionarchaea archaeon]